MFATEVNIVVEYAESVAVAVLYAAAVAELPDFVLDYPLMIIFVSWREKGDGLNVLNRLSYRHCRR